MEKIALESIDGKDWKMKSYDGIRTFTANATGVALKVGDLVVLETTQDYDNVPKVKKSDSATALNYIVIGVDKRYGKNLVTVLAEGIFYSNESSKFTPGAYYAVGDGTMATAVTKCFMGIAISAKQFWVNPRLIHDEQADLTTLEGRVDDIDTLVGDASSGRFIEAEADITALEGRVDDIDTLIGDASSGRFIEAETDITALNDYTIANSFITELDLVAEQTVLSEVVYPENNFSDGTVTVADDSKTPDDVLGAIVDAVDGSTPAVHFFADDAGKPDYSDEKTGADELATGQWMVIWSSNGAIETKLQITVV